MSKPPERRSFGRARLASFVYAWRGIVLLIRTQGNARIHLAATIAMIAAGCALDVGRGEWCLLALAAGLVWVTEAVNTALEVLGNRITTERDEQIGRAKDLAAGAVLLSSIAAAVVGGIVFVPRLSALI
jgi:diacylglycerol kinase (ATP)